eukprot:g82508.t1
MWQSQCSPTCQRAPCWRIIQGYGHGNIKKLNGRETKRFPFSISSRSDSLEEHKTESRIPGDAMHRRCGRCGGHLDEQIQARPLLLLRDDHALATRFAKARRMPLVTVHTPGLKGWARWAKPFDSSHLGVKINSSTAITESAHFLFVWVCGL